MFGLRFISKMLFLQLLIVPWLAFVLATGSSVLVSIIVCECSAASLSACRLAQRPLLILDVKDTFSSAHIETEYGIHPFE